MPSAPRDPAARALRTAGNHLVSRVEHWTAKRWALPATPAEPGSVVRSATPAEPGSAVRSATLAEPGSAARSAVGPAENGTRAETVHALVQRLADLAAGIEGRSPQAVPRLSNDLALPDQVRVMVADLQYIADDEVLRAAAADIDATAARLG